MSTQPTNPFLPAATVIRSVLDSFCNESIFYTYETCHALMQKNVENNQPSKITVKNYKEARQVFLDAIQEQAKIQSSHVKTESQAKVMHHALSSLGGTLNYLDMVINQKAPKDKVSKTKRDTVKYFTWLYFFEALTVQPVTDFTIDVAEYLNMNTSSPEGDSSSSEE